MVMWRHRLRVLEALLLIRIAQLLIRFVAFSRWRGWLGKVLAGDPGAHQHSGPPGAEVMAAIQALNRAIIRAPKAKCLPQAIALHKMLNWRGIGSELVIGILPGRQRGALDDLHGWVELDGRAVWGDTQGIHRPLFRMASPAA